MRTEELASWSGPTPVYVRMVSNVYDSNGRVTSATDARGYPTTTAFTTANGGLVTQTVVTNPLGQQVTTAKEPAWDLPVTTTDPNGAVTDLGCDGLGRLTSVWLPGRAKATQTPSVQFTYLLRKSGGPTAVTTENLLPTGSTYKKQVTLYDGLLRERQTQSQTTGGGDPLLRAQGHHDRHADRGRSLLDRGRPPQHGRADHQGRRSVDEQTA